MADFLSAIGMENVDLLPVIIKLALAVICGGSLGVERTRKRRAAGMRTYSMVCIGAAIVMMTGIALSQGTSSDPARLGAQVVSGIGFIGAGAIIVTGYHEIKGLTTAAGLWASACMGLAIGAGYYLVAILSCAVLFVVVYFGHNIQEKLLKNANSVRFYVMLSSPDAITSLLIIAKENNLHMDDIESLSGGGGKNAGVVFSLKTPGKMTQQEALDIFAQCDDVLFIELV